MAQPITKLALFRELYTQNNPDATKADVKREWVKYKKQYATNKSPVTRHSTSPGKKSPSRKKSPTKKSPIRRSPIRTSPRRYGGLQQSNLTGLGQDVTTTLLGHVGGRELATLSRTSKVVSRRTQPTLVQICKELPSKKEVVAYIADIKTRQEKLKVVLFTEPTDHGAKLEAFYFDNPAALDSDNAYFGYKEGFGNTEELDEDEDAVEVQGQVIYAQLITADADEVLDLTEVESIKNKLVDPFTLLSVLQTRVSCKKEAQYGLDLVRQYYKHVLERYLIAILGTAKVYMDDVSRYKTPENLDIDKADVDRLRLLVDSWLSPTDADAFNAYINSEQLNTPAILRQEVTNIIIRLRQVDVFLQQHYNQLQKTQLRLPGNKEIVAYIKQLVSVRSKGTIRIGFFHNRDVFSATYFSGSSTTIHCYAKENKQWYHIDQSPSVDEETVESILETRKVTMAIDLTTLEGVLATMNLTPKQRSTLLIRYLELFLEEPVGGIIEKPIKQDRAPGEPSVSHEMLKAYLDELYTTHRPVEDILEAQDWSDSETVVEDRRWFNRRLQELGVVVYCWLELGTPEDVDVLQKLTTKSTQQQFVNAGVRMLTLIRELHTRYRNIH